MPQPKGCTPWNKGQQIRLTEYHASIRRSNEDVFTEGSTYARHRIKKRIYNEAMLDTSKCDMCDISDMWNGVKMPFILDHINGVNNDHRIENLRLVCSNCDSTLSTYKSKNKKKKTLTSNTN